ncbi:hypothetical protein CVT26_002622 [Gymnopilus dilepis]|uniref:Uncharacterized protein n=1 Tax=Gymnopilus dilepis TaxID=231916 RepID=A0A409VEQ8_9AGAR|nr:hypothetical protein CVT26_002622 [Gymnopilus dilepis]
MAITPNQALRKDSKTDWTDAGIQCSALVLKVVEGVASAAPLPYLQEAAQLALSIVKIAQDIKDNKIGFQKVAGDCADLIATIWDSYEQSNNRELWLSENLNNAIEELVASLRSIEASLKVELNRGIGSKIIFSGSGTTRIQSLRGDLDQALKKFNVRMNQEDWAFIADQQYQVTSHINLNRLLTQVLQNSTEILGAVRTPKDAPAVSRPLEDASDSASISSSDIPTPASLPPSPFAGPNQTAPTITLERPSLQQHPQLDILAQLHTQLGQNPGLNSPSPLVPFALHNPTAFHPGLWPMAPFYPFNFAQTSSDTAGSNQGAASATGIIANCGNITSSGNVINSGNVRNTGHGNIVGCGNIKNAGIGTVANSGNVSNSGNIFGSGNISAPGNIMYSGNITGSGNISNSGNISTFAAPFGYHFNPPNVPPVSS